MLSLSTYPSLDPKIAKIFNEIKYAVVNGRIQPFVVDEVTRRVGIRTDTPKSELDVNGHTNTTTLSTQSATVTGNLQAIGIDVTSQLTTKRLGVTDKAFINNLEALSLTLFHDVIRTINGTAARPSHSFISDTDNGMYLIAANNLGLSAAGTKIVDISSTGVGVKTTNSPTAALQVSGQDILPESGTNQASVAAGVQSGTSPRISLDRGSGNANVAGVQWNIDNNSGTLRMFTAGSVKATLDSSGNFGVGTTNVNKLVNVNGAQAFYTSGTQRGLVGPPTWDASYMAMQNGTLSEAAANAAVAQDSQGNTQVGAASGRSLTLKINNVTALSVDSNRDITIGKTLNATGIVADKAGVGDLKARSLGTPYAIVGTLNTGTIVSPEMNLQEWKTWNPTFTGFSVAPTNFIARYVVIGKMCTVHYTVGTPGTSNSTDFRMTMPFPAKRNIAGMSTINLYINGGATATVPGVIYGVAAGSTQFQLFPTITAANTGATAWSNSLSKDAYFTLTYEVV